MIAHILVYLVYALLLLAGFGLVIAIARFFYYRRWRSDYVRIYYDDNDHRKGYYMVRRPRGPYPVGYPQEQIVKDMEEFERLKREQKAKDRGRQAKYMPSGPGSARPMWLQILLMTPSEYAAYRRRMKGKKVQ